MIFAFAAGLLSTVNPCGFAMLPAYLSFFVGLDEEETPDRHVVIGRALKIGFLVSTGFLAVFGAAGILIRLGGEAFQDLFASGLSWIALVTGAGVVALGVWLLLGNSIKVRIPNFRANTKSQGARSLFVFGVSYALASLSCAFPIFAGVIATSFGQNLLEGIGSFVAYSLGMAAIVMALTLGLALGKDSVIHHLRRASHRFNQVSGVVLVLAGAFIVFYWSLVIINGDNALADNPLTVWVESLQTTIVGWIGRVPSLAWAGMLGALIIAALAYAFSGERADRSDQIRAGGPG